MQNRQQMLAKIYNDGDLSGREDAYTSAVEKYGEGSKQARQAALQGTMSSLISVGTAMTNMSSSLKQLTEYQKTYDYYVAKGEQNSDDALDALSALQSEQYNFVGFAENLADAFDMTDNGKKAMMQLGYTISKNWKPIQNGFNKVWSRVQQNFPETAKKLTATLNLAMSEGAAETASSCFRVSSPILTETRWSIATVNCRTFSLTSRSSVCALMVTLKEVWPAAWVMGTVTAIPFSVVPFFFASCLALSMADWTELLSTAALPFLSGCMGLVSPVTGA